MEKFIQDLDDQYSVCDPKLVAIRVAGYAGFCFAVQLLSKVLSPFLITGYGKLSEAAKSNWNNRTISFVHASIMFYRAFIFWTRIEDISLGGSADRVNDRSLSRFEALTIDIMMGYLFYDTIYEFSSDKGVPLMLAHHVVGFVSHAATRYACSGPASYYTMMVYLAELSTPFLNVSWLLNELGNAPTLLLVVGLLLVLTFFVSRVVMGPYLLYHMLQFWSGGSALFYTNVAIIIFFILMNFYWFAQLMKKAIGGSGPSKKKTKKSA